MSPNIENNDWTSIIRQKAEQSTREVPQGTWDAIASKLPQQQAQPARKGWVAPRMWKAVAAAAAIALVATTGFFMLNEDKPIPEAPSIAENHPAAPPAQKPEAGKPETPAPQAQEPLLAQNNTPPTSSGYTAAPRYSSPRATKSRGYYKPAQDEYYDNDDETLQRYPADEGEKLVSDFDPEEYFYDLETMQALEDLQARYENAMNQEAMEPWRNYSDSTYKQYLALDANAQRIKREQRDMPKPKEKASVMLAAYGNGLISSDKNETVNSSSTMMLAPPSPNLTNKVARPVNYSYHHHMPLTFGLTFTKRIVGNLYGNIGANFTSMSSDVTPDNGGDSFKQNIKLIGVPFGVRWNFWRYRGLTTFVGGEGLMERVVSAKFNGESQTIKRLQWSVHATAGVQYNFNKHIGIYLEPKLSHYITTLPLNTLRNEHPFNFNLQMGISLDF